MHFFQLMILINFVLLIISLFSSLWTVYSMRGTGYRAFYMLSIRAFLAVSLVLLIGLGIATGQLGSHAPWDSFPAIN